MPQEGGPLTYYGFFKFYLLLTDLPIVSFPAKSQHYKCSSEDIRFSMDDRFITSLILLDFVKALDCVYHPLLPFKISNVRFSNGCDSWVRSYLSEHQLCVRSDDEHTYWRSMARGVSRGSVLGPLLFSIHIDNINQHYPIRLTCMLLTCIFTATSLLRNCVPLTISNINANVCESMI